MHGLLGSYPGTEFHPERLELRSQHNKGWPQHSPAMTPQVNNMPSKIISITVHFCISHYIKNNSYCQNLSPWNWSVPCHRLVPRYTNTVYMHPGVCTCRPSLLALTGRKEKTNSRKGKNVVIPESIINSHIKFSHLKTLKGSGICKRNRCRSDISALSYLTAWEWFGWFPTWKCPIFCPKASLTCR